MTPDEFARSALEFPEAIASSHLGQADFRVSKKIFATVNDAKGLGTLKLTPEQQDILIASHGGIFYVEQNAWGARGWTKLYLDKINKDILRSGMEMAYRNVAPKKFQALL